MLSRWTQSSKYIVGSIFKVHRWLNPRRSWLNPWHCQQTQILRLLWCDGNASHLKNTHEIPGQSHERFVGKLIFFCFFFLLFFSATRRVRLLVNAFNIFFLNFRGAMRRYGCEDVSPIPTVLQITDVSIPSRTMSSVLRGNSYHEDLSRDKFGESKNCGFHLVLLLLTSIGLVWTMFLSRVVCYFGAKSLLVSSLFIACLFCLIHSYFVSCNKHENFISQACEHLVRVLIFSSLSYAIS